MTFNAATWRTHPQTRKGKLYIHQPDTVYSGVVNQSAFNYPLASIAYDGASGTIGDVEIGMAIRFKDSAGNIKKYSMVRVEPTANLLYIPETSQGEIDFANNDTFEILDVYLPRALTPRYLDSGYAFKNWDIVVGTNTSANLPKANAGAYGIKDIAAGDTTVDFDFDGSDSYAVASGAVITNYAWDFVDGTPSSSTSASPTGVSFPAGYRWVSLTVTDSNGKTHTARTLIVAVDESTIATIPSSVTSQRGDNQSGWGMDVALYGTNLTKSDIDDGALVMYYEIEKYNGTEGSLAGYSDRENVKFVGYVTDNPVSINPLYSDVVFRCVNILGILQDLPAYPIAVERVQNPTTWFEMNGLTWWNFLDYILRWHSNVLEICDFERPDHWNIHLASRLDAVTGKLYDQVQDICQGVASNFTATSQGILKARKTPILMSDSDRSSHTVAVTLGSVDWHGQFEVVERHRDKVGWLNSSGVLASASIIQPLLAIAPGNAPSQGGSSAQLDRMLPTTQSQLNGWTGAKYADENKDFNPFALQIANMGLVVDPADMDFVRFNMPSTTNRRGVSFGTTENFIVSAVDITRDDRNGYALERWTLDKVVDYVDGITVIVPSDENGKGFESQPLPTYSAPPEFDLTIIDDFIDDTVDDNLDGIAIAWSESTAITFERISPFWETIHAPSGESTKSVVPDGFSDRILNNAGALGVYAVTGTALYYCEDALALEPTFDFKQWYDGTYELARAALGVAGGIGAFGKKSATNGYYIGDKIGTVTLVGTGGHSPDFWIDEYIAIPVGGADNKLYGVKFIITDAGTTNAILRHDNTAPDPKTWTSTSENFAAGGSPGPNANGFIFATTAVYNIIQSGETHLNSPPGSISLLPRAVTTNAGFRIENDVADTTTIDVYPIYYGSQGGTARFTYSDDYGDTITTTNFGGANGTPVGDLDDFGMGVVLAAYGGTLEYTDGDYKAAFNNASGANVAPYHHGCIRSPFLKFSNPAQRNNDPTAFEFLFAPSSKLDDDSTTWLATINSTTGVVSSGTDISPSFNGTPYVIAPGSGEQIELNPTNPNIIMGLFKPHSGGNTELLLSENGGSSWESKGEYDYNFIRWSTIGNSGAWLAGNAGFAYTPDRGDTVETRNGNYSFIGTVENARGVFPVG